MHMMAFHPNRDVFTKQHLCSCDACIGGILQDCEIEKGCKVQVKNEKNEEKGKGDNENVDDVWDDEGESSDEEIKNEQDENIMLSERGEMIMDMLTDIGSTFAIYSPSNQNELFYLCKLIKTGISVSNMVDENGHTVATGDSYIFCQYYEKIKEKRNCIEYKLLQPEVFVMPYQVFCPCVQMKDLKITVQEYQFLACII